MPAKAKQKDIASMSDEELMEEWTALGERVQAARARLVEFNLEHQRRERKKQLQRTMGYTEQDLELLQEIVAEGIETGESVGTPGGEG